MKNFDMKQIWIGFDPREADAFAVCRDSIRRRLTQPIPIKGLVLQDLISKGLYPRGTGRTPNNQLYDPISQAPMSTEFAISRFFVPYLSDYTGWAVFMDCDMLCRTNLVRLFEGLSTEKAVHCVKHDHVPGEMMKMDGQLQTRYARKNWSSFMVFNCEHPAHKLLTIDELNSLPGRELHRFCWLEDKDIGELDVSWNYLVDETKVDDEMFYPNMVHFTKGGPWMNGYEDVEYADEWKEALKEWAR